MRPCLKGILKTTTTTMMMITTTMMVTTTTMMMTMRTTTTTTMEVEKGSFDSIGRVLICVAVQDNRIKSVHGEPSGVSSLAVISQTSTEYRSEQCLWLRSLSALPCRLFWWLCSCFVIALFVISSSFVCALFWLCLCFACALFVLISVSNIYVKMFLGMTSETKVLALPFVICKCIC